MTPASIPLVKEALSRYSTKQLVSLAVGVLELATLEEVQDWLNTAVH